MPYMERCYTTACRITTYLTFLFISKQQTSHRPTIYTAKKEHSICITCNMQ